MSATPTDASHPSDDTNLPGVARRFLRYVQIDTQSQRGTGQTPSTDKQRDLSELLAAELRELGLDGEADEYGYVYARLPASTGAEKVPALALLAHVDTSPDEPGGPVRPIVHRNFDGRAITLPGDPSVSLDPERSPALLEHLGHDLISSDGTTLLGSDDKAGVAIIMQVVEDIVRNPELPRPPLRVCFTVDEEIGEGVDKLDLERLDAKVAYTIDGGPVGQVDTATFNASEAVIDVEGVMCHPGTAKNVMANAMTIACELVANLPSHEAPETTEKEEGYICPYSMQGDIARAQVRLLLRDFSKSGLSRRKQMLEHMVTALNLKYPRSRLAIAFEDSYSNMREWIDSVDPRVVTFAVQAGDLIDMPIGQESVRGGTDGARLSELGVPTPNLFTGGYDYHSRFEWNTVQNLETSLSYLKAVLEVWAREGSTG